MWMGQDQVVWQTLRRPVSGSSISADDDNGNHCKLIMILSTEVIKLQSSNNMIEVHK